MQLFIHHGTEYLYDRPAAYSVQYLRLTPRSDRGQRIVNWRLEVPGRATPWRDCFGNLVHCVIQPEAHAALAINVIGEVDTEETQADDRIRTFLGPLVRLRAKGDLAALHGLMAAIHDAVAYRPGETQTSSTATEVLAQGSGVCQDHAHLFIACCRAWGIPARYVSGYLHTTAEDGRHLATHAWAEAAVEHLGWVSFDPSNRQSATPAYVRLAVALDYDGAAPIRGLRHGGGGEDMSVKVRVQDQ